jgi:F0F1-type ATP synthase membrane subunit b/b'
MMLHTSLWGMILLAEGGWWARVEPYLNYPGFEAWKFFNLAIFVGAFLFILFRKAHLGDAFRGRREGIKNELERARNERDAALEKLKEVETRLAGLDTEIAAIKERSQREAAAERQRIAQNTTEEVSKLSTQAQRDIENAGKSARNELRRFAAEQSVTLAEQIIKRNLRPEDDARLINQNIDEMGAVR